MSSLLACLLHCGTAQRLSPGLYPMQALYFNYCDNSCMIWAQSLLAMFHGEYTCSKLY